MHELSIADALLAIVTEHSAGRRVLRVDVEVGHLRQVVPESLSFAFGLLAEGTSAEHAELVLHEVPAEALCIACGASSGQEGFPMRCGRCGRPELEVVRGEELRVESIEVSEEKPVLEEAR